MNDYAEASLYPSREIGVIRYGVFVYLCDISPLACTCIKKQLNKQMSSRTPLSLYREII